MNLQKFEKLKEDHEAAKQEADRAQGRIDGLMDELKKSFKCESLKEAKQLLVRLQREEWAAEKALEEAVEKFNEEYGDKL